MSVFGKVGKAIGDMVEFVIDGQRVQFPKDMPDKQIEKAIMERVQFDRFDQKAIDDYIKANGGVTLNADGSIDEVGDKYVTTITSENYPGLPTSEQYTQFRQRYAEQLKNPGARIGVFKMPDGGYSLDLNMATDDKGVAIATAKANNQVSVWDGKNFKEIPTGGTGDSPPLDVGMANFNKADSLAGALTDSGNIKASHWSKQVDITETDPGMFGKGLSGRSRGEMNRSYDPDFVKRTYFGIDSATDAPYKKEHGLGFNQYEGEIPFDQLYDIMADPQGLKKGVTGATAMEKAVKDAGYSGYLANNPQIGKVIAWFDSLPVSKKNALATGAVTLPMLMEEEQAEAGMLNKGVKWAINPEDALYSNRYDGKKVVNANIEDLLGKMSSDSRLDVNSPTGGKNAISDRVQRAKDHWQSGGNMDLTLAGAYSGTPYISDGRHRLVAAHQMGERYAPVLVDKDNVDMFRTIVKTDKPAMDNLPQKAYVSDSKEFVESSLNDKETIKQLKDQGYDSLMHYSGKGKPTVYRVKGDKLVKDSKGSTAMQMGLVTGTPLVNLPETAKAEPATFTEYTDDIIRDMLLDSGIISNPTEAQDKAETLNMLLGATGTLGAMQAGSDVGTFVNYVEEYVKRKSKGYDLNLQD